MLTNWECFAKRLGLDWMVMAMNKELQTHLGERSFLATGQEWGKAEAFNSPVGFKVISCNKLRSVLDVLRETNLDIVFSDADNVFKSDPFLPSLSLGSMIRSGKYEYIYGRKIEPGGQNILTFDPKVVHQEPIKANTGFYYVAGGKKQSIVQKIFEISVEWCNRRPSLDDQENFWDGFVATRNKKSTEKGYVGCFRHCDNDSCKGVDESMVLNYCDMSPFEYILGCFTTQSALKEPRMVSYHATHVFGWPAKKGKLQQVKLWANCDESEITGVKVTASTSTLLPISTIESTSTLLPSSSSTSAAGLSETTELVASKDSLDPLPDRLRRHAGLYKDKTYAPEFKNILLLTASNTGYLEMLTNWECFAKRLGLDWMVMAMNKELQTHLGERSFLATGQEWGKAEAFNSPVGFKVISCNKLRSVLDVLRETNLDIVFSDADNVFKSDPFLPSLSLGSMIRSGKYEYIYGRKIEPGGQNILTFDPKVVHQEPIKANTGFYYVAGGKKQSIVQKIFEISVEWCNRRPSLDDQENFWDGFVATRNKKSTEKGYVGCFRHCDNDSCKGVDESMVLNYCDMSPFEYILGCFTTQSALKEPRMVSYHATHVFGWPAKKGKLQQVKLWANCDESEITGVKVTASTSTLLPISTIESTSTLLQSSSSTFAAGLSETTELVASKDSLDPLPDRLRRHAGLYKDKTYAPEFKNILLLTASNTGYLEMLTNWECFAKRLGLDWMVMAMNKELQTHLGERSFLATGQEWGKAEAFNSPVGFKVISCNKLRSVLDVLRETNLDIVFSDADNVFKSDPFLPSLSLGSMIRSGKYEYIYGRKIEPGGQNILTFDPKVVHQEPIKANTGFYYVAGGKKQSIVQKIFEISVEWCNRRPSLDDQENFWDGFVATRNKKSTEKGYVGCFRHCDNDSCKGVDESMVLNYCDMSPFEYILGCFTTQSALKEPRMVSYHATHVFGWPAKKGKLQQVKLWANCDESEITGVKVTASTSTLLPISTIESTSTLLPSSSSTSAAGLSETTELVASKDSLDPLPDRLRRHAGLYKDKTYAPEFKNILLLTASNTGYLEMLTNWECFAKRLGLDWMVMAMNKELQTHLGERSFLATGQEWGKAEAFNSPVGFKVISCNKLRSVLDVLRETNLDIVFSDADNVFKSDPFLPSLSLGSMIRSGKYEYIYGRKIEPGGQNILTFDPKVVHQEPIKANTGFYYVAGGKKQSIVQKIFEISVEWCNRRPSLDDQENFWDGFVATRNKKSTEKGYVGCFRHCDNDSCKGVDESMVLNYCDMSPFEYILGCFTTQSALKEPRMVSYHATHVFGWPAKKGKLQQVKLWANCDESEITGVKVTASTSTLLPISTIESTSTLLPSSSSTSAAGLSETTELVASKDSLDPLPDRLRRHAGLYKDKTYAPEFKNILLLTASNTGYLEMLTNWECFAKWLGLDWMVMAMNKELQTHLGERSFLATGQEWGKAEAFNSPVGFKVISCNKLRSVLDVLRETNLDIVFSDADNVFKSDPFLPSLSLGSMIRSGKYEYIYGRKIEPGGQNILTFDPKVVHQEPIKANTGFYYVAGGKKQSIVQKIFEISVEWCNRRPSLDDQENFWDGFVAARNKKSTEKGYVGCFRHCDNDSCKGVDESMVLNYCDMSPFEYILGCFTTQSALKEPRMVSYHATHVFGWPAKKGKLQQVKLWANCDESEITGINSGTYA